MSSEQRQDPEPFQVIDRRGQPKEPRTTRFPPEVVTDIRQTEDPYKLVAIMPGNCIREREFRVTDQEKYGLMLMVRSAQNAGPKGQKAIAAAKKKVREVVMEAVRQHHAQTGTDEPSRVAEREGTQ